RRRRSAARSPGAASSCRRSGRCTTTRGSSDSSPPAPRTSRSPARARCRSWPRREAVGYSSLLMATAPAATAAKMTPAERANQRHAVLAGFLGWTLDAFDFFILTLVIDDIAASFGRTRPDVAFALTVTLAMRPIGAVVFGIMADRLGRRLPLMLNVIFYAVISVLSGLAPSYQTFLILRMLFGIGMGGEWGVGASLALESA